MWSMWNAPSDRDYYEQFDRRYDEDDERCLDCGASWKQVCEEDCPTRMASEEPAQ